MTRRLIANVENSDGAETRHFPGAVLVDGNVITQIALGSTQAESTADAEPVRFTSCGQWMPIERLAEVTYQLTTFSVGTCRSRDTDRQKHSMTAGSDQNRAAAGSQNSTRSSPC